MRLVAEDLLLGLNPAQREAVQQSDGPLLILAGAGSGKTKCLTHRIGYMVATNKATSDQILAITFTNKAAQEMAGRILALANLQEEFARSPYLTLRRYLPWAGTFHSVAARLLRAEADSIGLPATFTILDEDDRRSIIRRIIKDDLGLDPKNYQPTSVSNLISSAKNELLGPEEYAKLVHGPLQSVALEVYRRYQRHLRTQMALDFDDLIFAAVRLLEQFPEVRAKYHQQFRYLSVDEYQDTNHGQYRLTSLLLNPASQNLCVVGDDHQAIYGWRGADFRNILNFERDFPAAKVIKLEQNYRSTANILAGAVSIIDPVKERSKKTLWTENGDGAPITVYNAHDGFDEADFVAREILSLKRFGTSYPEMAILYRTNAQSRLFEEKLIGADIPYRLIGATRFYDRSEVKDLLAYLRLVHNPSDRTALERAAATPPKGIGEKTVANGGPKLDKFMAVVNGWRQDLLSSPPSQILSQIVEDIKFKDFLLDGTPEGEGRYQNVEELINLASQFNDISEFLQHAALLTSADQTAGDDSVVLMTLHASKGLEFGVVFLTGMEEGSLPHMRALEDESELDEERRLCYVGMTRAKKRLYLTCAQERFWKGMLTSTNPSRFISELDEAIVDHI